MKHALLSCLLVFSLFSHAQENQSQPRLAQLAIIIDDIGYNITQGKRAVALRAPVTLSVLPYTPGAQSLAEAGYLAGKQIMLHIPMSNVSHKTLDPGALTTTMKKEEFITSLKESIADIPHISGINNHMGSELTSMQEPMTWLMQELSQHKFFFIDSLTSAQSLAYPTAKQHGIIAAKRDIFLDNIQEEKAIEEQLLKAIALAKKQGYAIAIGHPYPSTLNVLEAYSGYFIDHGVLITPASAVALNQSKALKNSPKHATKNKKALKQL